MNKDKSTILNKKEEDENKLEKFLIKIAPYLIFVMFFILILLVLLFLLKNGSSITGTEANQYYYHLKLIRMTIIYGGI